MTLKLEGVLDILKMCPHTENEAACLRHSKLTTLNWIKIWKYVKVKMSKALNYFKRYLTDITIEAQQLPTSSFWVARHSFCSVVTLTLKLNRDLDILEMYHHTNNRPNTFGEGCTKWPHAYGTQRTLHVPSPITLHSEAETDRQTDTVNISKNSPHLMHSMQPRNEVAR